jgi:DNA-binding LacI/PurR family transcriptional regulator
VRLPRQVSARPKDTQSSRKRQESFYLPLVGFDGSSFSTFVVPSLSTIVRQTDVMSRLGTQKLLTMINEGSDEANVFETLVPTLFINRESTGPVPSS